MGPRQLGLLLITLLIAAQPAMAQGVVWAPPTQARAQLGVEGSLTFRQEGRSTNTIFFVQGTGAGTPARLAGLKRGDSIIAIDGRRLTIDNWAAFRTGLEPEQEVRLTLLHNGVQREVLVEAEATDGFARANRGSTWSVEIPQDVQIGIEFLQDRVIDAFETARVRFEQEPGFAFRLLGADSTMQATVEIMQEARRGYSYAFRTETGPEGRTWVASAPRADSREAAEASRELEVLLEENARKARERDRQRNAVVVLRPSPRAAGNLFKLMPVAPLPEEFMVMNGEVADSLTSAYVVLSSELVQVQQQRELRLMELVEEAEQRSMAMHESDGVLSTLDGENRRLFDQLSTLASRFREVREAEVEAAAVAATVRLDDSRHSIREELVGGTSTSRVAVTSRVGVPATVEFMPPERVSRLSARAVGQHFVMGAQFTSLNPGLSEYFEAEDGVLVVAVLEGTPAAEAGFLPGDVIVRAGRRQIHEVADLRRALAESRSGLRFRVIRKGDTLSVRLGG